MFVEVRPDRSKATLGCVQTALCKLQSQLSGQFGVPAFHWVAN